MEENKNILKLVIISLSVLFVALIINLGYKALVNENNNKKAKIDKNINYFVVSIPGEDEKTYLVGKKNNKYYELDQMDENGYLIGEYNNKIYYSDSKGIYYINNKNKVTKWFKLNQKIDKRGSLIAINKATIVKDNLLFTLNTPQTGLLMLSMDAGSFRETKLLNPNIQYDNWYFSGDEKTIYYLDRNNKSSVDNPYYIRSFKLKDKNISKISNDAIDMNYENDYIIYYNKKKNYELHLYNIKTDDDILITDNISDVLDRLNSVAVIKNNYVYYYINHIIYKYDITKNKKEVYYKLNEVNDFYNLYFVNDILVIGRENHKPIYLRNKKEINSLDKIIINMKNNKTKEVTIENITK